MMGRWHQITENAVELDAGHIIEQQAMLSQAAVSAERERSGTGKANGQKEGPACTEVPQVAR